MIRNVSRTDYTNDAIALVLSALNRLATDDRGKRRCQARLLMLALVPEIYTLGFYNSCIC